MNVPLVVAVERKLKPDRSAGEKLIEALLGYGYIRLKLYGCKG